MTLIKMEPAEGFEPTTYGLQNRRSNQLSYAGISAIKHCKIVPEQRLNNNSLLWPLHTFS